MAGAYGQTDVTNDPNHWLNILSGSHPRGVHEAALQNLDRITRERAAAQQADQFGTAHAQQLREFQDRQQQTGRQFEEGRLDREGRAREVETQRQLHERTLGEAAKDRSMNALIHLAQYSNDQKVQAMANAQIQKMMGVDPGATTDPRAAAVAGHVGGTVEQGGQPTGTQQPMTQQPTTQNLGSLDAPPVGPPGTAQTNRIQQLQDRGQGYVSGGVYGGPPGKDFNTNTGEWVPSGLVGTINGRPAGQVTAEMALAHGRTPESPSGQAAVQSMMENAKNLKEGQATTPPMNIPVPPPAGGAVPSTPGFASGSPSRGNLFAGGGASTLTQPQTPTASGAQTAQAPATVPPAVPPVGGGPPTTNQPMLPGAVSTEQSPAGHIAQFLHHIGASVVMPSGVPNDAGVYRPPQGGGQPQQPGGLPSATDLARQQQQPIPNTQ